MATIKAFFKKEMIEAKRQYKYIIIASGLIAFAILDPIMLKLLPKIFEKQIPLELTNLFDISAESALSNYIKNLFQIGSMFIIFTVSNTLNEEIYSQKLVFPYSAGANLKGIVFAKALHYILSICLFLLIGLLTAYYYIGILFDSGSIRINHIFNIWILISTFYIFIISFSIFLSSLTKKGITAGFISLTIVFSSSILANVKFVGDFVPYKLIQISYTFSLNNSLKPILFTFLLSLLLILITTKVNDRDGSHRLLS